jgi:predicted RNA-binding Zn ribbon-like protein
MSDISDLKLIGGHPALDLVNTVEPRLPGPHPQPREHLADPAALLVWARRAGFVGPAEEAATAAAWTKAPASGQSALSAVREIREALYAVLLAATHGAPDDSPETLAGLDQLHLRWVAAVARGELTLDTDGESAVRLNVGAAADLRVPDRAVAAAVDLLRSSDLARLRRCRVDLGGCGWMFLDHSRNGSRRWCQMADCGTQVKSRRLTERRRDARTTARPGTPAELRGV